MVSRSFIRPFSSACFLIAALGLIGSGMVSADDAKKAGDKKADPFAVPEDAKPEELLQFIRKTLKVRVRTLGEFRKSNNAVVKAAEAILKQKDVKDNVQVTAISAKLTALGRMARYDRTGKVAKQALEFAESLKNDKRKEVATLAKNELLKVRVGKIATLKANEREDLIDELVVYLKSGNLRSRFSLAMTAARGLERANRELAAESYKRFAKVIRDSKNQAMARYADKLDGSARRVMLMGNSMDLKGHTVDGREFDWSEYRGKVVLVDFWATWCGPCIRELPNVKRQYAKYHDKGFEVVAISLDRSKERLERFLKDEKIPWTNLFESDDPKLQSWEHPMATHYGVMAIPTVILVDQQGKVVSLNARGPALGKLLDKLLGGKKIPPKSPTKKEN